MAMGTTGLLVVAAAVFLWSAVSARLGRTRPTASANCSHVQAWSRVAGSGPSPAEATAAVSTSTMDVSVWCGTPKGLPPFCTAAQACGVNRSANPAARCGVRSSSCPAPA